MDQSEFRQELDALLPSPAPQLAERFVDFVEENELVSFEDILAGLRFVAQNFEPDTLASIPKMIDEQNMILPDEMVAAAICVQGGVPVDQVQQMAYEGLLMDFLNGRRTSNGGPSPLAVCSIFESWPGGEILYRILWFVLSERSSSLCDGVCRTARNHRGLCAAAPYGGYASEYQHAGGMENSESACAKRDESDGTNLCSVSGGGGEDHLDTDQREVTVGYNPLWLGGRR